MFEKCRHLERGRPPHVPDAIIYHREVIEMIWPRERSDKGDTTRQILLMTADETSRHCITQVRWRDVVEDDIARYEMIK